MSVCQECGINVLIFEGHAPGCTQYVEDEAPSAPESEELIAASEQWTAVIDVAADRGISLSKSILKKTAYKSLGLENIDSLDELDEMLFDDQSLEVMRLCSWAGVMAGVQVLIEQGFIDNDAVNEYLYPNKNGTI